MTDWLNQKREHEVVVQMVSPQNPDIVVGVLDGVDLGGSSLSAAYYTDTRTSGKLSVVGDGWVRGSFLRILVRFPSEGIERELGTYVVSDDPATRNHSRWAYDLELQSMLYALSTNVGPRPWTIASGGSVREACESILQANRRPYVYEGNDWTVDSPVVYESDTDALERLFSLCDMAGNRLDVNAHGEVTVQPYVEPSRRSASFEIDLQSQRGIAHGSLQRSTDKLSMPNRVAVAYRYSEQVDGESVEREINAHADATGDTSFASRGYIITDFRVLDELSPATESRAQELADQYLGDQREHVEWQLDCQYLPIWEGDVVTLVVSDGLDEYTGRRHCLVKNVELDLQHLTMRLTLKETSSGDDE